MPSKKILIVDDEEEILNALSRRLTGDGYEVITATRGREAVQKALMLVPDLLLIDIVLPDIDGSEVVQSIQSEVSLRSKPVIFLSGIVSKDGKGSYSEIKVAGVEYPAMGKPFTYEDLKKVIEQFLR